MNDEEVKALWNLYFESKAAGTPDKSLEKKLVEHYYVVNLIKKVAVRVHHRLTDVPVDELTSMGVPGLYDAVRNYDLARKTKFETYAPTRIRGAMLDGVRASDWVPRLVRSNATKLDKERQLKESAVGHRLSSAEMAKMLDMTEEDYERFSKSATSPAVHNIHDTSSEDTNAGFSIEHLEDKGASQPLYSIIKEELWHKLLGKNFTAQERQIMWLYYKDDHSMKEISEIVGLSESRVSQMHTDILKRLVQHVRRSPRFYSELWSELEHFANA